MSLVREPVAQWAPGSWRPNIGVTLSALYWLAATLLAARAYELGFHRYQPNGSLFMAADDRFSMIVARDAGLWSATATSAAALVLFLVILALREAATRLAWRIERRG